MPPWNGDEPSQEESISILRGLKERYEIHHGIRIKDAALVAAVELSARYIQDRFLPDKAIDLMDEAASHLRTEIDSLPEELDALSRSLRQLEIEAEALKKEEDPHSQVRLNDVEQELQKFRTRHQELNTQWEQERQHIQKAKEVKTAIEETRRAVEQAENEADLSKAAELKYGVLPALEKELKQLNETTVKNAETGALLKEEIDVDDIAEIVSRWTGIPVQRLLSAERQQLLNLENEIGQRVVGQDAAVRVLSDAIRRARAGLKDPHKPIGSFLLLGPTGVGKTETAKAVAELLFQDPQAFIRLDMSEYAEKHAVSRMLGSPPGYIGHDEGGQLTEAVRRKPYCVLLLDEVEKAHPDVFNTLLQMLDDGRLTDSKGRTVRFDNTLVLMTSNLGSQLLIEARLNNPFQPESLDEEVKESVMEEVRRFFKPEFLNRLDDIILFNPLSITALKRIVLREIQKLSARLKQQHILLQLNEDAIDWLARRGFDPMYGARPLQRVIRQHVENQVATHLLGTDAPAGNAIRTLSLDPSQDDTALNIVELA
jgi:ATP-dependent Clp protease ATP-binding subunit ClpB